MLDAAIMCVSTDWSGPETLLLVLADEFSSTEMCPILTRPQTSHQTFTSWSVYVLLC